MQLHHTVPSPAALPPVLFFKLCVSFLRCSAYSLQLLMLLLLSPGTLTWLSLSFLPPPRSPSICSCPWFSPVQLTQQITVCNSRQLTGTSCWMHRHAPRTQTYTVFSDFPSAALSHHSSRSLRAVFTVCALETGQNSCVHMTLVWISVACMKETV